jgi:hypothetical protein
MTEASRASQELEIVLPLGVIANQLMKIEADLRFLNMKALMHTAERENRDLSAQVTAHLEKINEALDLIRGLVSPRKPLPDRDD